MKREAEDLLQKVPWKLVQTFTIPVKITGDVMIHLLWKTQN